MRRLQGKPVAWRPNKPAASEDIPATSARKSDLANIIKFFVGGVHVSALGFL